MTVEGPIASAELELDRELLAAFRAGERSALERVYFAFVDDVFRLAALGFSTPGGVIRPALDPDEQRTIVQEVFVRAFAPKARTAYDGLRPYRPYLLMIARNLMVDRARTRGAENARASTVEVEEIPGAAAEVEEAEDQRRLREAARAFVATLDAELARLVELRFDHDLSQLEIADRMHITRRRVRTLEARVIEGFRRFLDRERPGRGRRP